MSDAKAREWNYVAFGTTLVLVYLEKFVPKEQDRWELIAKKSMEWLTKKFKSEVEAMEEQAVKIFQ